MNNDTTRTYLYQHVSPETAYVVQDYPWGFRLRTTIRYWIESKKAKKGGQRFASQTINPKTGEWCKPKYSTYSPILVMYLDEKSHVQFEALGHNSEDERTEKFKTTHLDFLDDFQKEMIKEIMAYQKVMKHVKFECKLSINREEEEKHNAEQMKKINRAINYEYSKIDL